MASLVNYWIVARVHGEPVELVEGPFVSFEQAYESLILRENPQQDAKGRELWVGTSTIEVE